MSRRATPASERPAAEVGGARTVASYFAAFGPGPEWDELVVWPPDAFALANLVLDHTESYRFVVAPPAGRRWPPDRSWNDDVRRAAEAWRRAGAHRGSEGLPPLVERCWETVTRWRGTPLAEVRAGRIWELNEALLTLHAVADEACAEVSRAAGRAAAAPFERKAWRLLQDRGSLSRLAPTRVRIVPKTQFSTHGITIRSLSRYLALCYESVDVRWRAGAAAAGGRPYSIVLVPWPLSVEARDFAAAAPMPLENMDTSLFGFFEFAPARPLDLSLVRPLLAEAQAHAGQVDAVIFPEDALTPAEAAAVERVVVEHGADLLIAGVRAPPRPGTFGRNYLHLGLRTEAGWERHEQDKHHRWCLDAAQIRQYHLSRALDPAKRWWEAIDVRERILHVLDAGGGLTTAPLVCEDLARLDEVADLVRRIGPSLVVAVLLDGPQLTSRWSCRYASILADEPGSTVLTLTAYGMAERSRPQGTRRSRVVALWNNRGDGLREIPLAPRAAGVLLSTTVEGRTLWTADGRRHADAPALTLAGVQQLSGAPRGPRSRRRASRRAAAVR